MTTDDKYWQEIYRILELARTRAGDDLLEKCLNGRQETAQSVSQLFKLAQLHFESGGVVRNKICEACLPFLEANLSFEDLERLKNPAPPPSKCGSVLDELEDN
jgi:hypothetical protein